MSVGSPPAQSGKRIRERHALVESVVVETPDTVTLYFDLGDDGHDYKAGQFLTIAPQQFPALAGLIAYLEDEKGKREPPRAYSMATAPHERLVGVTVKEEAYVSGSTKYPPLLSPYLVRSVHAGSTMVVSGFTGPYTFADDLESRSDHIVHICSGSGIVPNLSLVKHALRDRPRLRHTLLYSNKTWNDIIFRDQFAELEREHPDRLQVVHCLTRDPEAVARGGNIRAGRINSDLIREFVPDVAAAEFYCCGAALSKWDKAAAAARNERPTPRFMETVLACLEEIGAPKQRVHHESYG
jgi:3-ketosteroid 9alpha-monooxygenase subunit B